ncbi:tyrosine-protein phosphatase non-receptor type 22-like isoform X2 [Thalassophryne amazonica]|uniref:tyrosine-protein phosphatase non-receptor type 22-like isoform X2 n=1 Tax=Thalassophryne amazonica TaxID=390379 RepID=UPI001470D5D0|nr:tyrosine-protein phosphatase non-receptor type 22-like isoform X2 [Thalassophryne amazonica]
MTRSKSVRVKSFREERLSAAQQLVPPAVVMAAGGCAQAGQPNVNHTEASGHKADKNKEKGMSRAMSLKFFRHKFKLKPASPLPPSESESRPPSYSSSFSVFKLGFGNRFGKPKGPRDYPDTWV